MIACYALSGPLSGATGDQSLGEALSANKLLVYQRLSHKAFLEKFDFVAKMIEVDKQWELAKA